MPAQPGWLLWGILRADGDRSKGLSNGKTVVVKREWLDKRFCTIWQEALCRTHWVQLLGKSSVSGGGWEWNLPLQRIPDQISSMNPNDHLQALCQVRGSRNKEVTKFKALIYLLGLPWTLIIWGHPELILRSFGNSIPNCFFWGGVNIFLLRSNHQKDWPSKCSALSSQPDCATAFNSGMVCSNGGMGVGVESCGCDLPILPSQITP